MLGRAQLRCSCLAHRPVVDRWRARLRRPVLILTGLVCIGISVYWVAVNEFWWDRKTKDHFECVLEIGAVGDAACYTCVPPRPPCQLGCSVAAAPPRERTVQRAGCEYASAPGCRSPGGQGLCRRRVPRPHPRTRTRPQAGERFVREGGGLRRQRRGVSCGLRALGGPVYGVSLPCDAPAPRAAPRVARQASRMRMARVVSHICSSPPPHTLLPRFPTLAGACPGVGSALSWVLTSLACAERRRRRG